MYLRQRRDSLFAQQRAKLIGPLRIPTENYLWVMPLNLASQLFQVAARR